MKKNPTVKYVSYLNGDSKKHEVSHIDNGTIIDDVDSALAAQAIAQLACMGNLRRGDDGSLYISGTSNNESVVTIEEFVESLDDLVSDDGPEDKDEDAILCVPRDELENTGNE